MAFMALCADNHCAKNSYTAEEVMSILQQAIDHGSLQEIDPDSAPILAGVKESHANGTLTFWKGTEAEFNALSPAVSASMVFCRVDDDGTLYMLTDDSTLADFENEVVTAATDAVAQALEDADLPDVSKTYLLQGGTAITSGSDLNSYTSVGNYFTALNSIAAGLANCPVDTTFSLKVEQGIVNIIQTLKVFVSGEIYTRVYAATSGTWGAWSSGSAGGLQMVQVWENASPTSVFAAQTVDIDLSGYDRVHVSCYYNAGSAGSAWEVNGECNVGAVGVCASPVSASASLIRVFRPTATGVSFDNTVGATSVYMIPQRIYGIKGVE